MVPYEMDVSEMSSEGNTTRMANTIRPGSNLYLQQGLSLETTSHFKNGPFSNCQIVQIGNWKNDLKLKLLQKVKLASSTALSGLNNTLRGNRKPNWTQ